MIYVGHAYILFIFNCNVKIEIEKMYILSHMSTVEFDLHLTWRCECSRLNCTGNTGAQDKWLSQARRSFWLLRTVNTIIVRMCLFFHGHIIDSCRFLFQIYSIVRLRKFGPVHHYSDVIMSAMAYQITGVSIICLSICSGADQRPVDSLTKGRRCGNCFHLISSSWTQEK